MKLTAETLSILKNYGAINKYLLIDPGHLLQTSNMSSVLARTTIQEEFPVEVILYDLDNFLSVVGMFSQPVLDFRPRFVRITDEHGEGQVDYIYGSPSAIYKPLKVPPLPQKVIEFDLPEQKWTAIQKAASVLNKPEVLILSDGLAVEISTHDHKYQYTHTFTMPVAADTHGLQCQHILSLALFKLLKGSYRATVTPRFTVFQRVGCDMTYWVACDPASTFS